LGVQRGQLGLPPHKINNLLHSKLMGCLPLTFRGLT
jgi:hypothetical protein